MLESNALYGLRVLMTADAAGGGFNYALTLARELSARHVQVRIACIGPEPSADQWQAIRELPGLSLVHAPFALEWMDAPWSDVDRAGDWLLELARDFRPDLVHINGFSHASLPWDVPAVVVAHSCVVSWWHAVFGEPPPARYAEYRRRVTRGLNDADAVVAPSASMLESMRAFHEYGGPGTVIFNGVRARDYVSRPKQPVALAAGRFWDPAKNVELLLAAASKLPWPLLLAGANPRERDLSAAPAPVRYLGELPRSALARVLSEAAIFVHPARYEPFGLAPLEAALSGAALVLGRIDSLREIWSDCASYVSPTDPEELARVVSRLADDPLLRHALAARAERRARKLSSQRMANAYFSLYAELVGTRGSLRARSVPSEIGA